MQQVINIKHEARKQMNNDADVRERNAEQHKEEGIVISREVINKMKKI